MIKDCSITKELPKGGQKTVYLAQHPKLGQVVIKKGKITGFHSIERIKREVKLLSEIESPYYPKQYYFNINSGTNSFEIIEEFIQGHELRKVMSNYRAPEDILGLLKSLIHGLSVIWDLKTVHRDLKPENLIIRNTGEPCIIDLGIARILTLKSLTDSIALMGPCTPIYAAPEQLSNLKDAIDFRTDFFSLGIIALELYLGIHPFDSSHWDDGYSTVENIIRNKYVLETESISMNDMLRTLADRTLQTQPYKRFRNNTQFQQFIEQNL